MVVAVAAEVVDAVWWWFVVGRSNSCGRSKQEEQEPSDAFPVQGRHKTVRDKGMCAASLLKRLRHPYSQTKPPLPSLPSSCSCFGAGTKTCRMPWRQYLCPQRTHNGEHFSCHSKAHRPVNIECLRRGEGRHIPEADRGEDSQDLGKVSS